MFKERQNCVVTFIALSVLQTYTYAFPSDDVGQISARIKPVGEVRTEATPTMKENNLQKALSGQTIYEKYCFVCHQTGVAGAPKFREEAGWKLRLAEKDIEALVQSAIKGLNAMPQKGTCQECSDSDIKAAINYMVPQK